MLFFFFKPLAAILPGGQSAGRQECESGGGAEAAVAGRRPGTSHLCRPAAALSPAPARPAPGSIHCCPVAAPHHTSAALAVGKSSTQSRSHPGF